MAELKLIETDDFRVLERAVKTYGKTTFEHDGEHFWLVKTETNVKLGKIKLFVKRVNNAST